MKREDILNGIKDRFEDSITEFSDRSKKRVYIDIDHKVIKDVIKYMIHDIGARFNIASGIDARTEMEILYHFTIERINIIISFRVRINRDKPEIDSITPLIKGAEWIEREMHELLGINFIGHPNLKKLLLSEDWPEGVYPLRADYKEWDKDAIRDRGVK